MKSFENIPCWADDTNCAITVTDAQGVIIYMNDRSREVNARFGDALGHNLSEFHGERAMSIINRLLTEGSTNVYTISKNGVRKMIYQSAWFTEGKVAGLIEISMPIPVDMPHYERT